VTLPDTVIAMIQAAVPDVVVYDGIIPDQPPARYAIVYIDNGTREAYAACNVSDSSMFRWQVTAVAADRAMAVWVADTIADAIVDKTPTVAGWICGQIKHVFSERPARDETVAEKPMVFKPDLYELLATRA